MSSPQMHRFTAIKYPTKVSQRFVQLYLSNPAPICFWKATRKFKQFHIPTPRSELEGRNLQMGYTNK